MTKPEAHKFIARWRRILLPWFARTEREALRDMERSCVGMTGGGVLIFTIAATRMHDSSYWQAMALLGVFQFGVSLSLVLRFRQARRALDQSPIADSQ